uniref:Uncharacterized protein n=1 Tax=Rhizobium loti TaxID=381 RepID=Q8KGK8_RHILI|nr:HYPOTHETICAL PROTEIN [Mesorhizobium japonicum R7A]
MLREHKAVFPSLQDRARLTQAQFRKMGMASLLMDVLAFLYPLSISKRSRGRR